MKTVLLILGFIFLLALFSPTQAFTAESLTIDVAAEGGATVRFSYTLSWIEQVAVFFRVADPPGELASALEEYSGVPVTVAFVDSGGATFSLEQFARVEDAGSVRTLITPALQFTEAQVVLERYWFAPLISADFSPAVTTVQFPDGYREVRLNEDRLPSFTHQLVLPSRAPTCGCEGLS